MAEEKIRIILAGDAKGVVNAAGQAESSISKLGKIIGGLAIGGGALLLAKKGFDILSDAIRGTIGFIKGCIEEAGEEELQLKKLEQALISTSHYTRAGYEELQKYANELQGVTRYADENIVAVEAQLAMFKLSNEEIKKATQATLDLAAAKDMDLQSASVLIGKVMSGEMGMLKRYGIILDENTIKTGDWKKAIEEISIAFGGQAKAQAETYLGSMDRMKNAFGDIKEEIGNAFLPTLTKLVDWFMKGSDVIDPLTGKIENMASPFEKLKTWVSEVTTAFGKYLELNWENIIGFAKSTFEKIAEFIRIVKEADYTEITTGINDLKEAFGILIGNTNTGIIGAEKKYQSFIDSIGEGMQTLATLIAGIRTIGEAIFLIANAIYDVRGIIFDFLGTLGIWFLSVGQEGQEGFKNIDLAIQELKENSAESYQKMQESWAKFTEFMNRSSEETTGAVKEDLESVKHKGIETTSYHYPTIEIKTNSEAVKGVLDTVQRVIDGLRGTNIKNTVTTTYVNVGGSLVGSGLKEIKQSGGLLRQTGFIPDLGIIGIKNEAYIPADIVRAIKENRGSFAGINVNNNRGINLAVNVTGNYISDSADEDRLADKVGNVIIKNLRLQGVLTG